MSQKTDFLIIGTGVAGLSFALKMAEHGRVTLVAKSSLSNNNTSMAQGGIASVVASEDHFENHIHDTLDAGAGLCLPEVVRKVVEDAPMRIRDLQKWGVEFDHRQSDSLGDVDLTREGGHSHRRILHVQDHTGMAIQQALQSRVKENPNIKILENHIALELLTDHDLYPAQTGANRCIGASFLDIENHKLVDVFAPFTMLATGGAGKTYLYTSNWEGATGDGIAMAYRAGCRIANMEFMQFHPTCLFHRQARNFLISEALRGEGAELINAEGRTFTYDFDKRGPLAPRDIVARAIDAEMKTSGAECVYLDIRHKGKDFIKQRFPFIYEKCLSLGFDLAEQPLPVVPAAHYLCGGILTDEHGQTDLPGLFAVGECANTGLHGANRLASNSLLECLSFSHYAYLKILQIKDQVPLPLGQRVDHGLYLHKENADEFMLISHLWDEIRSCMWNYVGIVRSDRRLQRALTRIRNIEVEIAEYYSHFKLHPDTVELRNLATVARLTIECALRRQTSVGTHYNIDHPSQKSDLNPLNSISPNSLNG
ncbi:MAG: L-aspartate oxidase [Bdellovibrionales bacterium]|nr:L-aspartate oxidase [Bdellovibrionales bacterium]